MAKKISKRAWNDAKHFINSALTGKGDIYVSTSQFYNGIDDDNVMTISTQYASNEYQIIEIIKHATFIDISSRVFSSKTKIVHWISRTRISSIDGLYALIKIILLAEV